MTPWVIDARIGSMWINGQHINEKLIEKISKAIESEPEISRRELSRRVCEWVGWRSANGKLKEMSCRKVLQELQRRGSIRLPKSEKTYGFQNINVEKGQVLPWVKEADCDLSGLGRVEVIPVSSRYSKSSRDWNQLLDGYHYLGRGPLCGAQIRYLIKSEKYGCIGGLSFSGATRKIKGTRGMDRMERRSPKTKFREGGMQQPLFNSPDNKGEEPFIACIKPEP